jgi:hypothetical protein
MPRRPPKEWWYKTVRRLKKIRGIKSPERLAGWIWHHHMKPSTKRAILKATEKVRRSRRRR